MRVRRVALDGAGTSTEKLDDAPILPLDVGTYPDRVLVGQQGANLATIETGWAELGLDVSSSFEA